MPDSEQVARSIVDFFRDADAGVPIVRPGWSPAPMSKLRLVSMSGGACVLCAFIFILW